MQLNTRRQLITVVDDDPLVRASVAQILNYAGFRTRAFASAQAVMKSGTLADTHLLITDLRMPGLDGWDLHRHANEHYSAMPVIILTGESSVTPKYPHIPSPKVLYKPVGPLELLAAVHSPLEGCTA